MKAQKTKKKGAPRGQASKDKAQEKFIDYMASKFTLGEQTRVYKRFLVEAQAEWVKDKPGTTGTTEEHDSYHFNKLIESLRLYAPLYQKELILRYLRVIMPVQDQEYNQAEDEAILAVLFGDVDRGQIIRDCIQSLHRIPIDELEEIKWHLQAKEE